MGIMSVITVFGGYTVFLGILFAVFGILAGAHGKRIQCTRTAEWAVMISVFSLILCMVVAAALIGIYLYSNISDTFDFHINDIDFHYYYQRLKDMISSIIRKF